MCKTEGQRTMANTYSQIYVQVVFAVQGRQNLIHLAHKEEIYKYISGIIRNKSRS
jgi:putative transposase